MVVATAAAAAAAVFAAERGRVVNQTHLRRMLLLLQVELARIDC